MTAISLNKNRIYYNIIFQENILKNNLVTASWLDNEGKRFSMPVNSRKNIHTEHIFASIYVYFDAKKKWRLQLYSTGDVSTGISYQADGPLSIIDTRDFNYRDFIGQVYGNERGDLFYSGQSGFNENKTKVFNGEGSAYLVFRTAKMELSFGVSPEWFISNYSLANTAAIKAYSIKYEQNVDYTFPVGIFVHTEFGPIVYRGYGKGTDRTAWNWNLSASKDLGMMTLSLKCNDLLNKRILPSRSVGEEYCTTTLSRTLRRTILLGVTLNFGKSDSKRLSAANSFTRELTRVVTVK